MDANLYCSWLHHENSYLKLGPFQYEMKLKIPEMMIIHNFATEINVQSMIQDAKGKIFANPLYTDENSEGN